VLVRLDHVASVVVNANHSMVRYGRGAWVGRSLGVGCGLGVGVTLGVEVGVAVGVCIGVAVGVTVGLAVAVGVGVGGRVAVAVAVGVDVGVGNAVAVAVGVGVAPACTSNEPISIRPLRMRENPGPRWSKNGGRVKFGSPASIAGLPGNKA
jgi:hypothetical protein